MLQSVFSRFQQVDASDSREKGGSGLGLAICRKIVEQHGGEIWAGRNQGQGSIFRFTLPVPKERESDDSFDESDGPLVILCDDDQSTLVILQRLLARGGYNLVHVGSRKELIEQATTHGADVIMLDMKMGDRDGRKIISELTEHPDTMQIPIIILSSYPPKEHQDVRARVFDWIQKPIGAASFFTSLERIVGHRESKAPRIMLVEDDADMADVLTAMLNRHQIETFHARTGLQAIEFARTVMPDLMVLDLLLPEADGFTVVEFFRGNDRLRTVPLVIYPAMDLDDSQRDQLRLEQTWFFTKGKITPEEFERHICDLIDNIILDSKGSLA